MVSYKRLDVKLGLDNKIELKWAQGGARFHHNRAIIVDEEDKVLVEEDPVSNKSWNRLLERDA